VILADLSDGGNPLLLQGVTGFAPLAAGLTPKQPSVYDYVMIYQQHIPREELFAAQLELLMQHGRVATIGANMVGVLATVALFWSFVDFVYLLLWACGVLIMLLSRSLYMSNALVERRFQSHPKQVYWNLIIGSGITGLVWSSAFIYWADKVPIESQYTFVMLVVIITAISVGVTVVVREYFLTYMFTALWPISWWCLVHYWQEPFNLLVGLVLLGVCSLLVAVSNWIYQSFHAMISLNWEREAISKELGELTGSLRDRNRQLQEARQQLTDLASMDELTGLGNRRLINNVLQVEVNRARRAGSELSLIMLDVDQFKNYNDTYGHPAGDAVLKRLADLMQRATSRAGEVVARYGGEEFLLILPGASEHSAVRTANRLKALITEEGIPHGTSKVADYITVSQGVVTVRADADTAPEELIQQVDDCLYKAKDAGRNTIAICGGAGFNQKNLL
jgi:diguanylate cyclase (GGDEF)-like protein